MSQSEPEAQNSGEPLCSGDDCLEAVAKLTEFLDGELTDERRAAIQVHLDDCSHCLGAFGFQEELRAVVNQRCRSRLPDGLKRRVLEALRALDP